MALWTQLERPARRAHASGKWSAKQTAGRRHAQSCHAGECEGVCLERTGHGIVLRVVAQLLGHARLAKEEGERAEHILARRRKDVRRRQRLAEVLIDAQIHAGASCAQF